MRLRYFEIGQVIWGTNMFRELGSYSFGDLKIIKELNRNNPGSQNNGSVMA